MQGLMLLADSVGKEKRPLSWVIGEQGILKPTMVSMKEAKHDARMNMTNFRGVDEI
jgi:NADH-quinone oxidoreductase subunit B